MPEPRKPVLDRPTAMRLAATEYDRFLAEIRQLRPEEWKQPSTCPGWDVRQMSCHVLGMAAMVTYPWETQRQIRKAKKRGGVFIDALTGLQVDERADMPPDEIVARLAKTGPRAAKGRRRIPGVVRRRQSLPAEQTDGREPWTLGYLVDIVLTRDPWMHRMDLAAATERAPQLTADHDGVLVDDVVREWAGRHEQPCTLVLTGPAGGRWTFGEGGPTIELDTVEFCRVLSGRGQGDGLLKTEVPF